MDDAARGGSVEDISDGVEQLRNLPRRLPREYIVQALAFNVLHRNPQHLVGSLAEGVDRCRMVMDQAGREPRLTTESLDVRGIARQLWVHQLDDRMPPQSRLLRKEDLATAAFANLTDKVKLIPDLCAGT